MMPDREKVVNALANCVTVFGMRDCSECPYKDSDDCENKLMFDALALLKEQEPKVLTLEEADEHSEPEEKYSDSEKQPVYVEYANDVNRPWALRWLTVDVLHSWLDDWETRIVYGKDWRCWTFRPTDEQRKAVKWDEDGRDNQETPLSSRRGDKRGGNESTADGGRRPSGRTGRTGGDHECRSD